MTCSVLYDIINLRVYYTLICTRRKGNKNAVLFVLKRVFYNEKHKNQVKIKLKKIYNINKIIAGILALCLLCACSKEEIISKPAEQSDSAWSIFIYLCGSNLETKMGAAGKNIDEILAADIPDNVNVIVQTGGAKKWRSHNISADVISRYIIRDGQLTLLEALPQSNMGNTQTFADFLAYGTENYPAQKMGVIIWDHGSGSIDGVANDENYSFDPLTLPEMDNALKTVSEKTADKFELFGFDACLMANLETASMLAPYARYLSASEEIEPSGGWDYKALLNAISADINISGGELGKVICDSYFEKCKRNKKDSSVTLSVTDLEKLDGVQKAFDKMAENMEQSAVQPKGIQFIAEAAKNSQKFGGTSQDEGFSNLIDLRHFAENAVNSKSSKELIGAIEEAIIYKIGGSEKNKSGGLSFYYPMKLDPKKLDTYYKDICRSEPYKAYLKTVYENIPDSPIVFTDKGSEAEDSSFQINLEESSRSYILSVNFRLVELKEETIDEKNTLTGSWFGVDNDIFKDWDTLSFHSNFRGVWPSLNGCKLYITPVERTDEYIIFTAPIILNDVRTNLRFAFIWDDSYENGGYYKILGAWNGIDAVTGMSDKEITQLKPTDKIKTVYRYQTLEIDKDGAFGYTEIMDYEQNVPQGDYKITEEPFEAPDYLYQFVITDIFGREYYSYSAWMRMTKTVQELKEHPLPDGEYAADIFLISPYDDPLVEDE